MTNREGTPIWYELMTDAPEAAQDFYTSVMDWTFTKVPGAPGRDYRIFTALDNEGVGGVMKMPDGAPFPPTWAIYFGVDDVDAMAEKAETLGGSIHMPPQDIPNVGRFAFVADPQGALFYLMRGTSDKDSTAFAPMTPGHGTWNELETTDQAAALKFYGALFGWEKTGAMPMNKADDYTFFGKGDVDMFGGMLDKQNETAPPMWNIAFHVSDLDATQAKVKSNGGHVTRGPDKLPTSDHWQLRIQDPQGAHLILTGPRKQVTS